MLQANISAITIITEKSNLLSKIDDIKVGITQAYSVLRHFNEGDEEIISLIKTRCDNKQFEYFEYLHKADRYIEESKTKLANCYERIRDLYRHVHLFQDTKIHDILSEIFIKISGTYKLLINSKNQNEVQLLSDMNELQQKINLEFESKSTTSSNQCSPM